MEIFALLIVGEEIGSEQHTELYEEYRNNSEVYDILMSVLKKSNLKLKKEEYDYGILICGTGIGMSICANKIKGIYCAKVNNKKEVSINNEANI